MSSSLVILSGMAPGLSGLGALIGELIKQNNLLKNKKHTFSCRILWGAHGYSVQKHLKRKKYSLIFKDLFYWLRGLLLLHSGYLNTLANENILLIHPQTLGLKWCTDFIEKAEKPVWLFLADSFFFCIRSYNYIDGEETPCTRCIGGNFNNIEKNNCQILTTHDGYAQKFLVSLHSFAINKKINFIAQNKNQYLLARKHFGQNAVIKISGLSISDWFKNNVAPRRETAPASYDIAFHGNPFAAKGVNWALEVASFLPEYNFLFPFSKQSTFDNAPANCFFKNITWETGLRENIIRCKLVLVPSLWSAPIEGALIKSIFYGNNTAVVKNTTSYSDELHDNVIVKLPFNHQEAANTIKKTISEKYYLLKNDKDTFFYEFNEKNKNILENIINYITEHNL